MKRAGEEAHAREVDAILSLVYRRIAETSKRRRVGAGTWVCIHPNPVVIAPEVYQRLRRHRDIVMRGSPAVFRVCAEDAWIE